MVDPMTTIEAYSPFGSRGEWTMATEDQLTAMTDPELQAYEKLKVAFDSCAAADRDLADCERELHEVVSASREIEAKLVTMPRLTQHDLVMQMRETNR
jgi:hypothetical protein